jgi:DNA-binding NtrC family response regulator
MLNIPAGIWVSEKTPSAHFPDADPTQQKTPADHPYGSVLVVDDEILVADTVTNILKNAGFRTFTAYNAEEALKLFASVQPDCVLSDLFMPGMNGIELGLAIRQINDAAKIFLFSGQAGFTHVLEQARKEGHDFEFIAKPIHPEILIEILKKAY